MEWFLINFHGCEFSECSHATPNMQPLAGQIKVYWLDADWGRHSNLTLLPFSFTAEHGSRALTALSCTRAAEAQNWTYSPSIFTKTFVVDFKTRYSSQLDYITEYMCAGIYIAVDLVSASFSMSTPGTQTPTVFVRHFLLCWAPRAAWRP